MITRATDGWNPKIDASRLHIYVRAWEWSAARGGSASEPDKEEE